MKLLLDTHAFLWAIGSVASLSRRAAEMLRDSSNEVLVSVAAVWEIEIKRSIGKLNAPTDLATALAQHDFGLLPITLELTAEVGRLPLLHRDPFDRRLVAQARVEGCALVTGDTQIIGRYPVTTLW